MPEAQASCAPASCSGLPSRKGHSLLLTLLSSFLILCVNLRSPEPENFLLGREAQLLLARVREQAEESTHVDPHVRVGQQFSDVVRRSRCTFLPCSANGSSPVLSPSVAAGPPPSTLPGRRKWAGQG